jgi:hypothetical protein
LFKDELIFKRGLSPNMPNMIIGASTQRCFLFIRLLCVKGLHDIHNNTNKNHKQSYVGTFV